MNIILRTLFGCMLTCSVSLTSFAQEADEESPVGVDLSAALYSDYMFRGQNLYKGTSFQPSILPRVSLGEYGNLSGLLFFHISADDNANGGHKFFEMDEGITYDKTFGPATFSVGNLWYNYPDDDDDINNTAELYAGISLDTVLAPTVNFYQDYDEFDAQYYELNLSHKFETSGDSGFNITPFVTFGWASHAEKVYGESSGYVHTTYGATTELPVGDFTVKPIVAYTSGAAKITDDEFWMGFSVEYSL